jgi:hypothetical protein
MSLSQQVAALERENERLSRMADNLIDNVDEQIAKYERIITNAGRFFDNRWGGHFSTLPNCVQEIIEESRRLKSFYSSELE